MPTYQYRCRDCNHSFERVQSMQEHGKRRPRCPDCEGENVEQVLSPFFARTSSKT
jgi:putative FmdB family regulatory protein